jgi:branched-chain amino acid transport system ATP-binding protein
LLLDEPSAGLNAAETDRLTGHLQTLRADGTSLMIVDHKIDFINAVCDRVLVIESGRAVAFGTPAEVWADEQVVLAYVGRED